MNTILSKKAVGWGGLILLSLTLGVFLVKHPPLPDAIRETGETGTAEISGKMETGPDGNTGSQSGGVIPVKAIDPALLVSPTDLMQKLAGKERIILVDIRAREDFNKFKIPGAINIPLSFLKTKSFLRTAPVILINEGYQYTQAMSEAATLNDKGIDVKILEGGLRAWKQKGGLIVGDPFAQRDLNKMPASVFFQEKSLDNWVVIDVSGKPSVQSEDLIPNCIQISTEERSEKLGNIIQALYSDAATRKTHQRSFKTAAGLDLETLSKKAAMLFVLIFNENGEGYDLLETGISEAYREKVFFLRGGLEAYQKQLEFHRLAIREKKDRVKTTGECKSCDEEKLKKAARDDDSEK